MATVYSYSNIQPTMIGDALARISFTLRASDEAGNAASEPVFGEGPFAPPADGAAYAGAELLAICKKVAAASPIAFTLETRLGAMRTPKYVMPPPPTPRSLDDSKASMMNHIDANAAAVYNQFTRFQLAYEMREAAAREYKSSGYTCEPSSLITRFADNKSLSYDVATAIIIGQADTLRAAVVALEAIRMDKYKVDNARTLAAAQAEFDKIMADMDALARSLP